MRNVFDSIPASFFNYLTSSANQRVYADCLQVIYDQYEREISYRIPRNRIRDAIAAYLSENRILLKEDGEEASVSYYDAANAVIRRFCTKSTGWLEEESDDATYEKHILMTESGIMLAEFLIRLREQEKEEYAGFVFQIFNTLNNKDLWSEHPYVNGVKSIFQNARAMSNSLKRLSTFIRKIIERMIGEETLESLTENLLSYFDGSFIREYARLTRQQNIHIYRGKIRRQLDRILSDEVLLQKLTSECADEEGLEQDEASDRVVDVLQSSKRFLVDDYDRIMREIKHKINVYLQVAIARARFLRNREADIRGNVERVIQYITEEMEETGWKEDIPPAMQALFTFEQNRFIDPASIRYPGKQKALRKAVRVAFEDISNEAIERTRREMEREIYNPYAKDKMKQFLDACLDGKEQITVDDLPLSTKEELLTVLSAVAYGEENGYRVFPSDGYLESGNLLLRRFEIHRAEQKSWT